MQKLYVPEHDFARPMQSEFPNIPYGSHSIKDHSRILHSPLIRRLQGKMQLFPIGESDVLRNRFSHSHEVADIAVSICDLLNSDEGPAYFTGTNKIDRNIVRAVGLAHDIGHPPFGHDGEVALHTCMRRSSAGCFEGNAQTLRILTKLENRLSRHNKKRELNEVYSQPFGLNLTYRSLAGVVKYDTKLPDYIDLDVDVLADKPDWVFEPQKGYYPEEEGIVNDIKAHVLKGFEAGSSTKLSTIESQIMDLADDIAYSTYDLEDAMVAGVTTPFDLISPSDNMARSVAAAVTRSLKKAGYDYEVKPSEVTLVLTSMFREIFRFESEGRYQLDADIRDRVMFVAHSYRENQALAKNQVLRRSLTEDLIQSAIRSVDVEVNETNPELSKITIDPQKLLEIECLKAFNFERVIGSQTNKIHGLRARRIVKFVFDNVMLNPLELLPDELHRDRFSDMMKSCARDNRLAAARKARFVCDFVSEMTDEEALDFYRRISTTDRLLVHNLHHPRRS